MSNLSEKYINMADQLEVCVLLPTYNNDQTLKDIILRTLTFCRNIIIVNDGSTDHTTEILSLFPSIHCVHHIRNMGKGNAIKTGFEKARALGYRSVITMDSDGQHYPEDIPYFLNAINLEPNTIFVGDRNMARAGIPNRSSFGNRFSNFWFKVDTGITLPDTQSGYRVYPIHLMQSIQLITWKFEFEVEILVKAAWKGIVVKSLPVRVYYPPGHLRVSHFRPFQDFTRISILNTVLFLQAFFYFIPKRAITKWRREGFLKSLKRMFHQPHESIKTRSLSIGFGLFMGIFPVWGYQLIIGLACCHILKLNKALFVVSSHISIPPMIPFILYGSYLIGGLIVPHPMHLNFNKTDFTLEAIQLNLIQYLVGAVLMSIIVGIIGMIVSWLIYKSNQNRVNIEEKLVQ